MKKIWLVVALLTLPFVLAETPTSIPGILSSVGKFFLNLGQLQFLGMQSEAVIVGLVRLLLWLLIFTIFFAVITWNNPTVKSGLGFLNRTQAGIVAGVLATIAAIFLPVQVLLATGAGIGTVVSLVLIGGPVAAVGALLWYLPSNHRGWIAVRVIICLLLFWILTAMSYHINKLAGV